MQRLISALSQSTPDNGFDQSLSSEKSGRIKVDFLLFAPYLASFRAAALGQVLCKFHKVIGQIGKHAGDQQLFGENQRLR